MIQANCSKKTSNSLEKYVFFVCFSPLLCPRANRSYRSLLSCSFLKSNESDLLMLLFKKSNFERIAPVTLYKRAMGAICSFSQGNHSFAFRSQRIFTGESLFCFSLTKNEQFVRNTDERIPNPTFFWTRGAKICLTLHHVEISL